MQIKDKILRQPLREQVFAMLLDDLLKGSFKKGEKLKDTEIAEKFGVSRTPVREALIRLEDEGYLINNMGRGFEIASISEREAVEIYRLVAELEFYALTHVEKVDDQILNHLVEVNDRLSSMKLNPREKLNLDVEWHAMVISLSGNETLVKTIESFKKKTVWFELNYMKMEDPSKISTIDHQQIIALIKKGDFPGAARALKKNCLRTVELIKKIKE